MTTLIFTSDFGTCERLLRTTYLSETENIFFVKSLVSWVLTSDFGVLASDLSRS